MSDRKTITTRKGGTRTVPAPTKPAAPLKEDKENGDAGEARATRSED